MHSIFIDSSSRSLGTRNDKSGRSEQPWDRILLNRTVPIDVLVYTPQEIKERLLLGDFFIKNIVQKGKTLYAKKECCEAVEHTQEITQFVVNEIV